MSYQAYKTAQNTTESASQTEYRLLAQVTNALMTAKDKEYSGVQLVEALDWNRRVWSVFAADCGAKGNQLPHQLRANIISLSIWVSKHSSKVMRKQAKLDDLININRTIMEGLADQAKLQAKANAGASAPTSINSTL
ncbi:flagellar biosynthesis regulator FlaF [Kordiimonas sp. SCSIO 12603]|uniref:flagellar biosynthesis regulator FlaF n=1 Tax=Kordiimonas sp. SCSIO 12603 TaxID=2829596 RepID=UPI00210386AA|nr:flagellar biosynthesis regulator FlaF [Kordiimonas sp. SCSIO 12603]UTW57631.1 flagellar biosynthesis regulator FlaF [Kordiimonas sp. SCSIO 12603]